MLQVNAQALFFKAKPEFVNWLVSQSAIQEEDPKLTLEVIRSNSLAMLMSNKTAHEELQTYLAEQADEILAQELSRWIPNKQHWPKDLNVELLQKWFDIDLHQNVLTYKLTVEDSF